MKKRIQQMAFICLGICISISSQSIRATESSAFQSDFDVVQITQTQNNQQTWFGYYDKIQIDATGRYALAGKVDLFFRSPTSTDKLEVGLIDLENDFKWIKIGESPSWGWQQGCMMQWIPGSNDEVIWNDVDANGEFVSRVYSVKTKAIRTLPKAIYTLSPDGTFALCVDFDRLQFYRPGYGYPSPEKQAFAVPSPEDQGVYKMDLKTGTYELVLSLDDISNAPREKGSVKDHYHWFNHLLINPSGTRFIFLNRSRPFYKMDAYADWKKDHPDIKLSGSHTSRYVTRAMTADCDGSDVFPLCDSGHFSHFIWKGNDVITAWATPDSNSDTTSEPGFYEFVDQTKSTTLLNPEKMPVNGHNTYVPGTNHEWILNDTYPSRDGKRLQTLYLYHVPTQRKVVLGRFFEPEQFRGEWRCDLHPRTDQQGQRVFFDSSHSGCRQIYMINISDIINN